MMKSCFTYSCPVCLDHPFVTDCDILFKDHVDLWHPSFTLFKSEFGNCELLGESEQFKCQLCYRNIIHRSSTMPNLMSFKLKMRANIYIRLIWLKISFSYLYTGCFKKCDINFPFLSPSILMLQFYALFGQL